MDTNDRDAGGGLDQLVSGLYSLVKRLRMWPYPKQMADPKTKDLSKSSVLTSCC